jgi:hypothetical protein
LREAGHARVILLLLERAEGAGDRLGIGALNTIQFFRLIGMKVMQIHISELIYSCKYANK